MPENSGNAGTGSDPELNANVELAAASQPPNTGTQNSQTGKNEKGSGGKKKPDPNRKMSLVTFIRLAKPNKYVEAMLKYKLAMEVHTQTEWKQIITDLLKQKV
jgi:hypothetical protein